MKYRNRIIIAALVFAAFLAPCGCKTYDAAKAALTYKTSPETADQILVRTEQLTKQALYTFDTFLFIEANNEAALQKLNPQIHVTAEKVRANGKNWLKSARAATAAFKQNRTAANEANLRTASAALTTAYEEVKKYQAQADTLSNKTP